MLPVEENAEELEQDDDLNELDFPDEVPLENDIKGLPYVANFCYPNQVNKKLQ